MAVAQFVCGMRFAPALRRLQPLPQLQIPRKLAFLIIKLHMRLVGGLLRLHRAVAHVLHAQGAGNHQHLIQRATLAGFHNHAAHARVQRQFGEFSAHGG